MGREARRHGGCDAATVDRGGEAADSGSRLLSSAYRTRVRFLACTQDPVIPQSSQIPSDRRRLLLEMIWLVRLHEKNPIKR